MRTKIGLSLLAASFVCGIALHAANYAGHWAHGEWHNGILVVQFDIEWHTHWIWITPICVIFLAGVYCLIFPNYQPELPQTLDDDEEPDQPTPRPVAHHRGIDDRFSCF